MPRSRSCSIQSIVAHPSCTSPMRWTLPVKYRIRSLSVVFPASIWAMMPILRMFSSGTRYDKGFSLTEIRPSGTEVPPPPCRNLQTLHYPRRINLKLCRTVRVVSPTPASRGCRFSGCPDADDPISACPPQPSLMRVNLAGSRDGIYNGAHSDGWQLPAVVSEGLVCLRHTMRIIPLLDRPTIVLGSSHEFGGQSFLH